MDVDIGLLLHTIQVGKETLENMLLDGGSKLNLIIKKEYIWLGIQTPLLAPYWLHMADQAVVQPIGPI